MPRRYPADDPREWLNRARSNLALAKAKRKGIYLEDLCFDAQQAVEKAIKALLIKLNVNFPYVHDLAELLTLVEKAGQAIPERIKRAEKLSRFAVFTRYPKNCHRNLNSLFVFRFLDSWSNTCKWAENIVLPKRRK